MIRMNRGGGDSEAEKQQRVDEAQMARMMTVQNVLGFLVVCGLIRAG